MSVSIVVKREREGVCVCLGERETERENSTQKLNGSELRDR